MCDMPPVMDVDGFEEKRASRGYDVSVFANDCAVFPMWY